MMIPIPTKMVTPVPLSAAVSSLGSWCSVSVAPGGVPWTVRTFRTGQLGRGLFVVLCDIRGLGDHLVLHADGLSGLLFATCDWMYQHTCDLQARTYRLLTSAARKIVFSNRTACSSESAFDTKSTQIVL